MQKKIQKKFFVWETIASEFVSLTRPYEEQQPSAAIVFKSSPKTWHVNQSNFFKLNCLDSYQ